MPPSIFALSRAANARCSTFNCHDPVIVGIKVRRLPDFGSGRSTRLSFDIVPQRLVLLRPLIECVLREAGEVGNARWSRNQRDRVDRLNHVVCRTPKYLPSGSRWVWLAILRLGRWLQERNSVGSDDSNDYINCGTVRLILFFSSECSSTFKQLTLYTLQRFSRYKTQPTTLCLFLSIQPTQLQSIR